MKIQEIRCFNPSTQTFLHCSYSEGLSLDAGIIYLIESTEADPEICLEWISQEKLSQQKKTLVVTLEGIEEFSVAALDEIRWGNTLIELIQVKTLEVNGLSGKIMKGIIRSSGRVGPDDTINFFPKIFKVNILTLSDRAFRGEYEDRSGPEVERLSRAYFEQKGWKAEFLRQIIPDDSDKLLVSLQDALSHQTDLIITTGGTGVSPRDITPEVVKQVIEKEIPGIMEMIRLKHGALMPRALLSRAVAGVKDQTLIYAIPGSMGAVKDYMSGIHETLEHLFFMVRGVDNH